MYNFLKLCVIYDVFILPLWCFSDSRHLHLPEDIKRSTFHFLRSSLCHLSSLPLGHKSPAVLLLTCHENHITPHPPPPPPPHLSSLSTLRPLTPSLSTPPSYVMLPERLRKPRSPLLARWSITTPATYKFMLIQFLHSL